MQPPLPPTPFSQPGESGFALNGLGVLVTRPEHQAGPLCHLIERYGGIAIRCPALSIGEPRDWIPALTIFDRLADYHLAIFTSANAVERALPPIQKRGGIPPFLEIAAIGRATARMLARFDLDRCLQPESDFTSEGLLALPRFQRVAGQAIVIVRGEGGRALLAETLTARGARVDHAEVYRRERPAADVGMLLDRWARGEIGAVVVTSAESLLNLFDMLGGAGQDYLRDTPLIMVGTRIRQTAAEFGCRRLLVAREASDDAIAAVLLGLTANLSPVQFGNAT
ncbi:MAG TPA: uroporphyrinogen-III synthase [Candidatus Competibacter sp.]|nr:uroporphyrinogen-III synthase [Candidatus Competibacter sp.]